MQQVISVENMRKSDELTTHTIPATELMARAAEGILAEIDSRGALKLPAAVVCGVGNNAGDGFAIACLLAERGDDCTVFLLIDRVSDTSRPFLERCMALGVPIKRGIEALSLEGFGTVIDCILGVGLRGEVREPFCTAIDAINSCGAYVVSADINSGLGGDSGLPMPTAVRSDLTVSVGAFKAGHFLNSAKDFIKAKVNREIGIKPIDEPAYLVESSDIRRFFVRDRSDVNKGDFGYVALIGGSRSYSGAAKLANLALSKLSMAALRSGAGVAKLAVPACVSDGVLPYLLESTLFELDDENGFYRFDRERIGQLLRGTRSAAVGMGMGRSDEVKKLIGHMLAEYTGRLIIDADGLNALSELGSEPLKSAACRVILTPHPKEFERLSGVKLETTRSELISAAKSYAGATSTILLLKGSCTVVTDGKTVYLVDRGCPGMSTAGSGDVLSGILAGICGRVSDDELLLAVAAGAYLNGLAGELAGDEKTMLAMTSGDTVESIPSAVKQILGQAL